MKLVLMNRRGNRTNMKEVFKRINLNTIARFDTEIINLVECNQNPVKGSKIPALKVVEIPDGTPFRIGEKNDEEYIIVEEG